MAYKIYILYFLYLFPMWISKTLQPIYWQQEEQLKLFSISYVMMAVAGACSLLYAKGLSLIGTKIGLFIGFSLYGGGLILRAYPIGISIAVTSGLMAGVGASIIAIALKSLIFNFHKKEQDKVLLHTDNISTIAQSLGAFVAGGLVSILSMVIQYPYHSALFASGVMVLIAIIAIPSLDIHQSELEVSKISKKKSSSSLKFFNKTNLILFIAFIISGTCWALILPIIPIYLKNMHFSDANVGLVMSAGVIAGFLLKNYFVLIFSGKDKSISLLFFSCLCMFMLYTMFWSMKFELPLVFAVSIIAMYMFRTVCSLLINFIEMEIAQNNNAEHIFGLVQTAFLTGDILGGIALPYVYESDLMTSNPIIIILLILLSNVLVCTSVKIRTKKRANLA
ncbi:MFS transporter [Providencia burhodogranariea]|uniref:Transporter, major facilitator family protein n=1 Tax=Providencia burhodogranariea DSM 19968 TaxID=1141662 RepID=K8VYW1_9GAMM|nr:transporter, major facilitator family protein [Providencia burhodogranariea DSM 19968]